MGGAPPPPLPLAGVGGCGCARSLPPHSPSQAGVGVRCARASPRPPCRPPPTHARRFLHPHPHAPPPRAPSCFALPLPPPPHTHRSPAPLGCACKRRDGRVLLPQSRCRARPLARGVGVSPPLPFGAAAPSWGAKQSVLTSTTCGQLGVVSGGPARLQRSHARVLLPFLTGFGRKGSSTDDSTAPRGEVSSRGALRGGGGGAPPRGGALPHAPRSPQPSGRVHPAACRAVARGSALAGRCGRAGPSTPTPTPSHPRPPPAPRPPPRAGEQGQHAGPQRCAA